ncbi:VCBS repeat-containing protein [Streptomyces goshikiensis]|uniref:FG-GAP repeat domain-containing protein n=1 Tax=Streptomyces goshikiensis TaxID=1942 RepID=UPI003319B4C9
MRPKRSGRIAACTAVALAAGMLLAGPASADGTPKAPADIQAPSFDQRAGGHLPKAAPKSAAPKAQKQQLQRGAAGAPSVASVATSGGPLLDVDGDGVDDILYRTLNGKSWLKNSKATGDDVEFTMAKSDYSEDFKDVVPVGDLDHNGHPELLQLSVTGRLSLVEAYSTSSSYSSWSGGGWGVYNKLIGAGDLTGDGNPDVLARTPAGALYLYPGNGKAGASDPFNDRIYIGGGWGMFSQIIGGADYDGDGKADLLATTPSGVMYFYKGTGGAGTFASAKQTGTGWNTYNQIVALSDRNGNSWVLGREVSGQAWIYQVRGDGFLGDRMKFGPGWEYINLLSGQGGVPAHGKSEAYGRTSGGALYGYFAHQDGNFEDRQQLAENGSFPSQVGMALASSLDTSGEANMLWWYGGDLYSGDTYIGGGWDVYNSLVGVGDLNGDGYGDLLARDKSNVLWFYESKSTGTGFFTRVRVGGGWGIYNKLLGAGDVTGDGIADLVARGTDGTLWAYPGTGHDGGVLGDRVKIGSAGWNSFNKLAAVGDITGDGLADLMAVDSSGTAYRYSATGLGGLSTFNGRSTIGSGWNTYTELH